MCNFPQKGKQLFVDGGHPNEFSHIAWGHISTRFYTYVVGYKTSADLIVKDALGNPNAFTLDICIFPVCFLYRQYLELALKDLYLNFSEDNTEKKKDVLKEVSHDLKAIWKKVRSIIERYCEKDFLEIVDAAEGYIKQFSKVDKFSSSFRYPITKKFSLVHENEIRINLSNLKERMQELEFFMDAVGSHISVVKEEESEFQEMEPLYEMLLENQDGWE